ncbi:MAG: hypothetical protein ABII79_12560 [bacterium]
MAKPLSLTAKPDNSLKRNHFTREMSGFSFVRLKPESLGTPTYWAVGIIDDVGGYRFRL